MLWIIFSIVCAVYYAAVRYVAQAQQLTGIWLILAVLFLALFFYRWYRKKHLEKIKGFLRVRTFCVTTAVLVVLMIGVVAGRILADIWSSPHGSCTPQTMAFLNPGSESFSMASSEKPSVLRHLPH